MKIAVFHLYPDQNIWIYENIQLQKIEQEWVVTMNHERQICESIYDAINKIKRIGFTPTFHMCEKMKNIKSKCN